MRINVRRSIVAALVGVLALSTIAATPAEAHRWHRGNAAVLGAVLGVFGTIAVLAARDRYRDDYYGCYGCYYGGPVYAYPGPYYYGGRRVWHHRYYGGSRFGHHRHHWHH